ncbi:TRADD-N-associated membrane domain-containing protein [Streptomyces purpureus]|uniref:Cyanobacterial TRADD-N associated 2 transmembrane domain-containing protein n=1 Tax=Streptomyces purpureus TaxID=1951 RepID=A0A918H599_9ACTN|nr:hypothetical protein [Streptomyces purpureus]GGT38201.1 hypothetical protein GCM10014713_34940 [Streptomyces purpureus]
MNTYLETAVAVASAVMAATGTGIAWRAVRSSLDSQVAKERKRLRESLNAQEMHIGGDLVINTGPGMTNPDGSPDEAAIARAAQQRIDDDRFAELLVEYYAYGLAQARNSFLTSQWFAGLGATILLLGVGLAIWRAETTGDLYLSIATSAFGLVTALIGQLFHRRADLALSHMAQQTDSLRDDMRTERSTEQAIMLLAAVSDPATKTRLQAGLIMKLAGSDLPQITAPITAPTPDPTLPKQTPPHPEPAN